MASPRTAAAFERAWSGADGAARRRLLDALIERVAVDPARKPWNVWRPERVKVSFHA